VFAGSDYCSNTALACLYSNAFLPGLHAAHSCRVQGAGQGAARRGRACVPGRMKRTLYAETTVRVSSETPQHQEPERSPFPGAGAAPVHTRPRTYASQKTGLASVRSPRASVAKIGAACRRLSTRRGARGRPAQEPPHTLELKNPITFLSSRTPSHS
jgi:hypothetical protein